MGKNLDQKKGKHFSDLEIDYLENKYKDFVLKSSIISVCVIILLFILSPNFFDRLQYEDGYVENLTVVFLVIAILGIGKFLIKALKDRKNKDFAPTSLVISFKSD